MSLSPKKRFEILRRDGFTCRYCGLSIDDGAVLHVDHIVPRSKGGSDHPRNLCAACDTCNLGKSATMLDAPTLDEIDGPHFQLGYREGFREGMQYQRHADEWARQRVESMELQRELTREITRAELADAYPDATAIEVAQAAERYYPRRVGETWGR